MTALELMEAVTKLLSKAGADAKVRLLVQSGGRTVDVFAKKLLIRKDDIVITNDKEAE